MVTDLSTKDIMKRFNKKQSNLTAMSVVASNYHHKIKELERLVQNPGPDIKRREGDNPMKQFKPLAGIK